MDNNQPMDTNTQILNEFKSLSGRMSQMENRMDNLSSKSSSPARTSQQSRSIQDQEDTRIRELQAVDREKGKFKTRRGGSETIWVKHEIAWPHNSVLSGNSKNRVTYDSLSITQWVSAFATIIRDETDDETPMILVGHLQKVPTLFCFAEWRKEGLHGRKPITLTELGELMLICQPPNLKYLVVVKNLVIKMHLSLVSTSKETHLQYMSCTRQECFPLVSRSSQIKKRLGHKFNN